MSEQPFTIIHAGTPVEVKASIRDGKVRVSSAEAKRALECEVDTVEEMDLVELAARLARPIALDLEERAAYLGVSARARSMVLTALEAPDFTLPDLHGRMHSLVEQRGKKVLLVAYASW